MEEKIKSGKEVIDEFFSEILNIEGVDEKTVDMLVQLYGDDKLTDTNIQNEFREWWKREYNTKCPKTQELVNYLNIKLGAYKKRGWWGYEIIYDEYDSE